MDGQIVAPAIDVVGNVDDVPDERAKREELLRHAVRHLPEKAAFAFQPEADAVLGEREPLRSGERDVQDVLGVRSQQREVGEQPTVAPRREISLELWEVVVADDVAQLDRAVATEAVGRRELHASLGPLEHGERVGPGLHVVVEAVADEDVLGRSGRGKKRGQDQQGEDSSGS